MVLFYFWLHRVFTEPRGVSLVAASGSHSAEVHGLLLRSFSCCGAQAVGARASVAAQLGLSRCGAWAWLPRGMWDLPEPGMEPTSPALAGRFLATGSPGRPYISFNDYDFEHIYVYHGAFLVAVAWMVTNLPAVPEM